MTHEEFDRYAHMGVQLYDSIIGTNDPDLSEFRARGGKILGYHGLVCVLHRQFPSRFSHACSSSKALSFVGWMPTLTVTG